MKQNGKVWISETYFYGINKNILAFQSGRPGFYLESLFNMYKTIKQVTSLIFVKYS